MTARKMLLGLGSPFSQSRVDFNLLHGTDSSSGTNPFSGAASLNDGSGATGATRAADSHASAYIVQSASTEGAVSSRLTLPAPATAGNLLVAMSARADLSIGTVCIKHGAFTPATFTVWESVSVLTGARPFYYCTRVSDGSDGDLDIQQNDNMVALWEVANYGTPSGYERKTKTEQAAANPRSLGGFTNPGALQLMGQIVISDHQLFTIGAGWTQDTQRGSRGAIVLVAGHDAAGDTPQITGNSDTSGAWAGVAVGITTSAPDTTSIAQADLGAAYPVNRITLTEAAATGTQYAVSYSNDGSSWTGLSPTFSAVGAVQTYDLASTVAARYWRLADNHSPAVALTALDWRTWTIEGFPF